MWVSSLRSHSNLLAVLGVKPESGSGRQAAPSLPLPQLEEALGAAQSRDGGPGLGTGGRGLALPQLWCSVGRWSLSRQRPASS